MMLGKASSRFCIPMRDKVKMYHNAKFEPNYRVVQYLWAFSPKDHDRPKWCSAKPRQRSSYQCLDNVKCISLQIWSKFTIGSCHVHSAVYIFFGPLRSARTFWEVRKFHMFRPMFLNSVLLFGPYLSFYQSFSWLLCWKLKLQYPFSGLDCQFIQGHCIEFSIRNCTVWSILFFWMFSPLLKEPTFIFCLLWACSSKEPWLAEMMLGESSSPFCIPVA